MIYFQPETALRDLGPDGSSPVSHSLVFLRLVRSASLGSKKDVLRSMRIRRDESDIGQRTDAVGI